MQGIKVLSYTRWYPGAPIGLNSPFWGVHEETIIATWLVLALLVVLILVTRYTFTRYESARYIISSTIRYFMDITEQTIGFFNFSHFSFVSSLFMFIFLCNIINVLVPWVEEPTSDINTTLALGIISFLYTQGAIIHAHGIGGYMKELTTPFFLFPLHVIGKLATIVSISFRLFGNIFGSAIITQIYNKVKMGSVFIETGLLITGLICSSYCSLVFLKDSSKHMYFLCSRSRT